MFDSFEENYTNKASEDYQQEYDHDEDVDDDDEHINEYINSSYNRIVHKPLNVLNKRNGRYRNENSLKTKLLELYLEEELNPKFDLNYSTHLLQKLVEREQFNTLVLNLYSIEKGYSIGFNIKARCKPNDQIEVKNFVNNFNLVETKLLSYDETELLFYINNGEIPPVIIDLVDRLNVNMYEDGCIIMEIRDYRRFTIQSAQFNTHFILLQPSMQTLVADLNSITNDGNFIWTQEDKYTLESQLILATAQPLCLHPSPIVSILKHKILNHKRKLNDRKLKRNVFKFTNTYLNRAARWNEYDLPLPFHIRKIRKKYSKTNEYLHFQTNNSENLNSKQSAPISTTSPSSSLLITSFDFQSVDNWAKNQPCFELPREDMILVKKFANNLEYPKYTNEQTLVPIEEIVLEAVDKNSKNNYSRLIIKRRNLDDIHFCQLSLCSDQSNDVLFELGFSNEAEKYIQQYIKIFTEEGRRPVAITKKNMSSDQRSQSLLRDTNQVPSLASDLKQTSGLSYNSNSTTFQSYFNKKAQNDFNDKQLQNYQNFLFQQQQSMQNQQKQIQNQKLQQHMHVQKQLQNQIRKIKSTYDEQITKANVTESINSTASNLKNLIQNPDSQSTISPSSNLTRIYSNKNSNHSKSKIKNDSNKCEISSASTTVTKNNNKTNSALAQTKTNQENINSKVKDETTKIQTSTTSTKLPQNYNKNSTSQNFVQIYVPKIASPSLTKSVNQTQTPTSVTSVTSVTSNKSQKPTQTITLNNSSNSTKTQPAKKTYTKKRASSSSNNTTNQLVNPTDNKKKKTVNTADSFNTGTTVTSNSALNTKPMPFPSTKIINASNLNLFRKIAIDSRSMPVIVTLNSSDPNDTTHHHQQSIQNQFKLKSQQQSKQIKLINNRVSLKPAITNSTNDNQTDNLQNQMYTESIPTTTTASPIKTFQFQKPNTQMLKQLSFPYNSQSIHNIKPMLSTVPINQPSSPLDIASTQKFLVTSSNQKSNQLSTIKPSLVTNKKNEHKEPLE